VKKRVALMKNGSPMNKSATIRNSVFHTSFAAAVRLFAERVAFHRDLIF